jgi:hypothetical protein
MSFNSNKPAAVWTQVNPHFAVSNGGCIKPSGDGFDGRACYLTLDQATYILLNIDSLRKAIDEQRKVVLHKETGKEQAKMVAQMVRMGLTPEQATQAVAAIFSNKAAA